MQPATTIQSNFNGLIQAAGVTSLIKCILMLKHQVIPPHPSHELPINRQFPPLSENNIHIPRYPLPFLPSAEGEKKRILINNFNATVCFRLIFE